MVPIDECTPAKSLATEIVGPLLDRIDLHVEVPQQSITGTARVARRVERSCSRTALLARERRSHAGVLNARLDVQTLENDCRLGDDQADLLETALTDLACQPGRAIGSQRARTIADLEGSPQIDAPHLLEAIGYRVLTRVP